MPRKKKEVATKKSTTRRTVRRPIVVESRTDGQQLYLKLIEECGITLCDGSAGTGKTMLAVGAALKMMYEHPDKYRRLIMVRPAVTVQDEEIGFLPGDIDDKMRPFIAPMMDSMQFYLNQGEIQSLVDGGIVEVIPISYMRGRAQPLCSDIITPGGVVKMGDISIGDNIIGSDGNSHTVTGVYSQGKIPVYRIAFSDGKSVECCGDHLWAVKSIRDKNLNKEFRVESTLSIIEEGVKTKYNQCNFEIPLTEPVSFNTRDVPVDPYLLGILLGDGCIHEKASISFSSSDEFIHNEIANIIDDNLSLTQTGITSNIVFYKKKGNTLRRDLETLELVGKKSWEKFVPHCYKYNSFSTRLSILQGLLDSDGSCFEHRSGKSRVQFYSTSKALAEDVVFLTESMGGVANIREKLPPKTHTLKDGRKIVGKRNFFTVDIKLPKEINPFRLPRKRDRFTETSRPKRLISGIEYVGEKEARCISVSAKNKLYLTNNFIVTHNTFNNCILIFDEAQNSTVSQMKMVLTRIGFNTKAIIEGDSSQSDLVGDHNLNNGLKDAIGRFGIPTILDGFGIVQLGNSDIVRSPIVKNLLTRY